jgi:hypothetical protein
MYKNGIVFHCLPPYNKEEGFIVHGAERNMPLKRPASAQRAGKNLPYSIFRKRTKVLAREPRGWGMLVRFK